jgi:hypothetical protein
MRAEIGGSFDKGLWCRDAGGIGGGASAPVRLLSSCLAIGSRGARRCTVRCWCCA